MAQSLESIPNNVDLSSDRRLQRALEQWQPNFLSWWREVGPDGFQAHQIYLRTAVSVEPDGWATFDYVRMPEYRWGIFLTPRSGERKIGFGDNYGESAWDEVPGEHRDGKYQLAALAESGFDPLARTTRFMLTEEAHHLFVGEMGVDRVVQRTGELMAAGKDPRTEGAVPLDVIQRYLNQWFTLSLDL